MFAGSIRLALKRAELIMLVLIGGCYGAEQTSHRPAPASSAGDASTSAATIPDDVRKTQPISKQDAESKSNSAKQAVTETVDAAALDGAGVEPERVRVPERDVHRILERAVAICAGAATEASSARPGSGAGSASDESNRRHPMMDRHRAWKQLILRASVRHTEVDPS